MNRILVLSHVYPRPSALEYGVFVAARVRSVARDAAVEVVSPVPWFPFAHRIGRLRRSEVPRTALLDGIPTHYPTVPSVPGIGRSLDAGLFAATLLPVLQRIRARFPFELIDAHFGYPDGVAAVLLGRRLGCPVLMTLRGNEHAIVAHSLRRRQLSWAVKHSSVVAVSQPLLRLARDLGAPSVHMIPNGIDQDVFAPGDRADARRRLGLPSDRPIVLGPGAYVPNKRHDRMLRAVEILRRNEFPELLYVAVGANGGTQGCLPALRREAQRLGIKDHVRFIVDRPHAEMAQWYRAADVVGTATAREGSPNALIEALACGTPVVAPTVGDIPSLVRSGIDGFLLADADGDTIAAALSRSLAMNWDRSAIATHAARRDWIIVAAEVHAVMRAVIRSGNPATILTDVAPPAGG